jgi:hypothetical protein
VQQPILSTTADRAVADTLTWEALTPEELLARFDTRFERSPSGQAVPIVLDPVEGEPPPPTQPPSSGGGAHAGGLD